MEPITKTARIGVKKNNSIVLEIWPKEYGWQEKQRDKDFWEIEADRPEIIELNSQASKSLEVFFNKLILHQIEDLKGELGVPENDYEEGYEAGLISCERLMKTWMFQ